MTAIIAHRPKRSSLLVCSDAMRPFSSSTIFKCVIGPTPEDCKRSAIDLAVQNAPTGYSVSFLLSKLSSISTLLGSRRKICQRALIGHLVHVVRDSLFGEMPLRCLEAAAAESDMIDDTRIGMLLLLGL